MRRGTRRVADSRAEQSGLFQQKQRNELVFPELNCPNPSLMTLTLPLPLPLNVMCATPK